MRLAPQRWLPIVAAATAPPPLIARRTRSSEINEDKHKPYTWSELRLHAANQSARFAAGEYPGRSSEGNAQYEVYKRWCVERGLSNEQYVLRYVKWQDGGVALEPALAPYLLERGLEHWILWHNPEAAGLRPDAELQPELETTLAMALLEAEGVRGLSRDDLVCFQNVPALRSLPRIPHSHVFVRKRTLSNASRRALQACRRSWRVRSPWLQSSVEQEEVRKT